MNHTVAIPIVQIQGFTPLLTGYVHGLAEEAPRIGVKGWISCVRVGRKGWWQVRSSSPSGALALSSTGAWVGSGCGRGWQEGTRVARRGQKERRSS